MSDPIKQYRAISERLYNRTKEGSLHWEIEWQGNNPVTTLAGFTIRLRRAENAEGEPLVIVDILNQNDEFVDSFSDTTLSNYQTDIADVSGYWTLLDRLFSMAYRAAKGADKALEAILKDLDDEDPPF